MLHFPVLPTISAGFRETTSSENPHTEAQALAAMLSDARDIADMIRGLLGQAASAVAALDSALDRIAAQTA
jgi:hypothetical protein